jgi:hypothetical protein
VRVTPLGARTAEPSTCGHAAVRVAVFHGCVSLGLPTVIGLLLTSSVLASLISNALERNSSHLDRVREQYASATRALAAWNQFPVRIQRRVDDEPETRRRLSEFGSDISEHEALARVGPAVGRRAAWR